MKIIKVETEKDAEHYQNETLKVLWRRVGAKTFRCILTFTSVAPSQRSALAGDQFDQKRRRNSTCPADG